MSLPFTTVNVQLQPVFAGALDKRTCGTVVDRPVSNLYDGLLRYESDNTQSKWIRYTSATGWQPASNLRYNEQDSVLEVFVDNSWQVVQVQLLNTPNAVLTISGTITTPLLTVDTASTENLDIGGSLTTGTAELGTINTSIFDVTDVNITDSGNFGILNVGTFLSSNLDINNYLTVNNTTTVTNKLTMNTLTCTGLTVNGPSVINGTLQTGDWLMNSTVSMNGGLSASTTNSNFWTINGNQTVNTLKVLGQLTGSGQTKVFNNNVTVTGSIYGVPYQRAWLKALTLLREGYTVGSQSPISWQYTFNTGLPISIGNDGHITFLSPTVYLIRVITTYNCNGYIETHLNMKFNRLRLGNEEPVYLDIGESRETESSTSFSHSFSFSHDFVGQQNDSVWIDVDEVRHINSAQVELYIERLY